MTEIKELYKIYLESGAVSTDSRNVIPGSVFFALRGERFNGNHFAREALLKGASRAVVDDPACVTGPDCILVDDALTTLQSMAKLHRRLSHARIVGITGSNGKTTTKELIGAVLSSHFRTVSTPGNLNNHIGVPLSILAIRNDTEFAVVEMGANHPGEIAHLCDIADPRFGLITNIGKAHLEGFGGYEGVIRAKSELYQHLKKTGGTIFYNIDNALLTERSQGAVRVPYGTSPEARCKGAMSGPGPSLKLSWSYEDERWHEVSTNLIGEYNFENVIAAICVGAFFNVPASAINQAIKNYTPKNNRSQQVDTGRNKIILDAYNANPSSMEAALINFSLLEEPHKAVILGDMMELGTFAPAEHRRIVQLIREHNYELVLLVGRHFLEAASGGGYVCCRTTEEAEEWLSEHPQEHRTILVKGSRKMALEKLLNRL